MASTWCNLMDDRHIGFFCVNFTLIHILSPEMNSLAQKMVYIMYYTRVLNKNCQNQNFLILRGVVTFDDPENYLNDLEKIQPYDFQLDGPLKIPNQQKK